MTARRGTAMKLLPSYDRSTQTLRSPLFRDLTSYRRFCSNQGPSRQIVGFAAQVEADASVECIGRASKELLCAIGLSAGEFKKVDPEL
jgi:hypothetical protein